MAGSRTTTSCTPGVTCGRTELPADAEWIERLELAELLPDGYAVRAAGAATALADRIAGLRETLGRPVVIGMAGAQGAGKTTLALFLANWLAHETGLRSIRVSLDDFYFGKAIRTTLAQTVHPLLATRGVPGTHDVEVGRRTLAALTATDAPGPVTLPVFDKASDDRVPGSGGTVVEAPVDVVVFEGWCVGARPQAPELLAEPLNVLERQRDPIGRWRGYVNERLAGDYATLFDCLDALVFLRVPSFAKVRAWRRQQEHELRGVAGGGQTDEELAVFIMHYERLTRHMLDTMPGYADTVIDIDAGHRFAALTHPGWGKRQSSAD